MIKYPLDARAELTELRKKHADLLRWLVQNKSSELLMRLTVIHSVNNKLHRTLYDVVGIKRSSEGTNESLKSGRPLNGQTYL